MKNLDDNILLENKNAMIAALSSAEFLSVDTNLKEINLAYVNDSKNYGHVEGINYSSVCDDCYSSCDWFD